MLAPTAPLVAAGRVRRVDALFDAVKRRRADAPGERQAVLDVEGTPAIVVKCVFQTTQFAGKTEVSFARSSAAPSASP